MSAWTPRVYGYSPGSPRRSGRSSGRSSSVYAALTSIPESVNRRGSSGPTIGAIVRCSPVVAIAAGYPRGVCAGRLRGPSRGTPGCAARAGSPSTSLRRPGLDHDAVVHEHHRVADLAGEADLVRDDDHRHPVGGQLAHRVEHVADQLGVERRGRLVEQHQLRLHRQRPGDRHALLLAAGQRHRVGVELVAEADAVEQLASRAARASPRSTLGDLDRRQRHVLERGHVREQVEVLEDHPDLGPLARDLALVQLVQLAALLAVADQLAVDRQPAGVDLLQVVDAAQERRLARARRPEQAHHLAAVDLEVIPLSTSRRPKRLCTPSALTIGVGHCTALAAEPEREPASLVATLLGA